MNYVYTSSRVSVLWNRLLTADTVEQLISARDAEECYRILNSAGISGGSSTEILERLSKDTESLMEELFDDLSEIEVLFYGKNFHNLKAAVKRIYSKSSAQAMYVSAPVSGEEIETAIREGGYDSLPSYMKDAAKEAYEAIMRTGDGQTSDLLADKATLAAMMDFAAHTKHEILKKYVYETVAAADIKIAHRLGKTDAERAKDAMVDCPYFTAKELASAAEDEKSLEEFLKTSGFTDIDMKNIDRWSGERIARMLDSEKYAIFTPSPAIHFILAMERQTALIRLILVCKESGVDEEFIVRKAVRTNE